MNERYEQLFAQAWIEFAPGHKAVLERFAELIVRECLNAVVEQKEWVENMPVHNPHDEAWNRARIQQSQHIVDKIKEHFGVEE